jgi:hypothetical protein
MPMSKAERAKRLAEARGDTGAPPPPPLDDDQTLEVATGITPTVLQQDAAVLAEKRRRQDATTYEDAPTYEGGEAQDFIRENVPQPEPEPLKRPRQLPANKSFGALTDDDLLSLAIENVFPKSLEVDEREEGWKSGLAPVEPQYPTEGTVSQRLAFLTKRRNQKRENIETAERQNLLTEKYEEADRSASFLSAATDPKRFPGLLLDEAVRYAGPKVSEKVQAFMDRLDRLEETEARLAKSEEERAKSQAEIRELRQRLDRFIDTAEPPAE